MLINDKWPDLPWCVFFVYLSFFLINNKWPIITNTLLEKKVMYGFFTTSSQALGWFHLFAIKTSFEALFWVKYVAYI